MQKRDGYIWATKNGVKREFSEFCWKNLGTNKQGWRLINVSEEVEVEIIEKKNLAENLNQESAAAKSKVEGVNEISGESEAAEKTVKKPAVKKTVKRKTSKKK